MKTKPYPILNSERTVLRGCLDVIRQWGLQDHILRANTGGAVNPKGQLVMFGTRGQSDLGGVLPEWFGPGAGKRIVIECKRENWKPPKPIARIERSINQRRAHWLNQLAQLDLVNEAGGYGFWCDDSGYLWKALMLISHGHRVAINPETERPEFFPGE